MSGDFPGYIIPWFCNQLQLYSRQKKTHRGHGRTKETNIPNSPLMKQICSKATPMKVRQASISGKVCKSKFRDNQYVIKYDSKKKNKDKNKNKKKQIDFQQLQSNVVFKNGLLLSYEENCLVSVFFMLKLGTLIVNQARYPFFIILLFLYPIQVK